MEKNKYGQGRMVIYIGENLQPHVIRYFLEGLAMKANGGGIISPVSFTLLDASGRTLEARGSVEKIKEIVDIISNSIFLEDRICLFGVKSDKAIHYFSFAADYFNNRTGSVGFCKDYFPGFIKIRKGATALEKVMSAFRGIIFDPLEVIEIDIKGKIVLLQQEIEEKELTKKRPIDKFQDVAKGLISQEV